MFPFNQSMKTSQQLSVIWSKITLRGFQVPRLKRDGLQSLTLVYLPHPHVLQMVYQVINKAIINKEEKLQAVC